jgi:ArsR family transcriptional regulator
MADGAAALAVVLVALILLRYAHCTNRLWIAVPASAAMLAALLAWDGDSFLRHPNAVGLVFGHHNDPRLPEIDHERISQIVQVGSHLIIDCRYPDAFADGHIPGAKNAPVNLSPGEQMAFLRDYPRSTAVIVYCQSEHCQWARSFASAIHHFGFKDTAIYAGGWNEWDKHEHP